MKLKWTDPGLTRVTALRVLMDPELPDMKVVSCTGRDKDGMEVDVELPFLTLPRKNYEGALLDYGRRDDVFIMGLDIFEAIRLVRAE